MKIKRYAVVNRILLQNGKAKKDPYDVGLMEFSDGTLVKINELPWWVRFVLRLK